MKKLTYISTLILLFACNKKPLPVAEESEPVFYLKGQLNNSPLYLVAGEQNYYMNSDNSLDTTGVYVFKAELKQINCDVNCNYAITVLINDKAVMGTNQASHANETLVKGDFRYNDQNLEPLYYNVVFRPDAPESGSDSYVWTLRGQQYNSYQVSSVFEANDVIEPTLTFQNASGSCGASHSNSFYVGHALQTRLNVAHQGVTSSLQYAFSSNNKGFAPFIYHWDFGDGSEISTDETPVHVYTTQGYYTVKLSITDSKHDSCVSYYQLPAYVDAKCEANFNANFTAIPNTKAFSAITVLLRDANGKEYSSKDMIQPDGSSFEILEVSDYLLNERNQATKKIKIRFNCEVQNNGEKLILRDVEGVLAVSYR